MSKPNQFAQAKRFMAMDNPWPWLVYLTFYFVPWLFRPPTQQEVFFSGVGIAIFLVSYFWSFKVNGLKLVLSIAVTTGVGLALTPISVTSTTFIIFAAAATGNLRPGKLALATGLGLFVIVVLFSVLTHAHVFFWAPSILFGGMTGISVFMSRELVNSNKQLEESQEEAKKLAAMAERERIARDLHDLLGHTLTVIAVKSELASKVLDSDPERARAELVDINATTRGALADIRGAISGIKNTTLAGELASARLALESADVSMEIDELTDEFPASIGSTLAMLVREGVTNIIRHSEADTCRIRLQADDGQAKLIIEDDGCGVGSAEGNGLSGMRARVKDLRGTLVVSGPPGTTITACIPLVQS